MPKIISFGKFKVGSSKETFLTKIWKWYTSLDIFYRLSFIVLLLLVVVTPEIVANNFSIFQHAATSKTATINVDPSSNSYSVGQLITVTVTIAGNPTAFNAAQATVTVSPNLTIQSLSVNAQNSGGCGFNFLGTKTTPSSTNPSFAGAILNGSATTCILYTMTLQANAVGTGTITLTKGSVKAYVNSAELLASMQSASFTITSVAPTATPTPPILPTATPTSIPPTPTIPVPTATPTPTATPLQPPTIDAQPTDTYAINTTLTGTKTSSTVTVMVNGSSTQTTYPTTTTWQAPVSLNISQPNVPAAATTLSVSGVDASGATSQATNITLTNHRLGDIDGDGQIGLKDLSEFGTDWENTGTLNYPLSDMNNDGIIDLTDFSILARVYGN